MEEISAFMSRVVIVVKHLQRPWSCTAAVLGDIDIFPGSQLATTPVGIIVDCKGNLLCSLETVT